MPLLTSTDAAVRSRVKFRVPAADANIDWAGVTSYTYDNDVRLLTTPFTESAVTATNAYDQRNRLFSTVNTAGGGTVGYGYNLGGTRSGSSINFCLRQMIRFRARARNNDANPVVGTLGRPSVAPRYATGAVSTVKVSDWNRSRSDRLVGVAANTAISREPLSGGRSALGHRDQRSCVRRRRHPLRSRPCLVTDLE